MHSQDSPIMIKSFVLGLCAVTAVAGATSDSSRSEAVAAGADPRLIAAVTKANSDFEVAMTKLDTASIVAPYATDAVFVSADGTATKGRAGIERLYRDRFAKSGPVIESRIESQQLVVDGGFAYERGHGSITREVKGQRVTDRARFLTVWQRQRDGDWKIFRNIVLPGR